jgi:hypothetical protein
MFRKLLGGSEARCQTGHACPAVLELNDGSYAVVGSDITSEAKDKLPPGTGCGQGERIIRIPRSTLVRARNEIPEKL